MKKLLLGIGVFALLSCPAFAADLPMRAAPTPVATVFSWTGLYVGANVGGHWGSDSISTTANPVGFPPPNIDALSPTTLKPQGVTGGFQMGYNWQINNFVFGLEGDANWLGGTASRHLVFPPANAAAGSPMDNSINGRFLGTFRPRAGITFDRLFLYATGGVALGSVKTTDSFCNDGCAVFNGFSSTPVSANGSATKVGWTVGAGAEWAITDTWSIKVEYLYVDLGSFDASIPGAQSQNPNNVACGAGGPGNTFGIGNCSIVVHHRDTDNIARVGVNYHF
jgi:outer membrane immunogenic protein